MDSSSSWSWHLKWMVGAFAIPLVYAATRGLYFQVSPFTLSDPGTFQNVYKPWWLANTIYVGNLAAGYAALYVLVSLVAGKISRAEASFHLVVWTLVPPLWFAFERYFLVDMVRDTQALKEGQDYASKLWSAVLAVLLAFKLGEIVKGPGLPRSGRRV